MIARMEAVGPGRRPHPAASPELTIQAPTPLYSYHRPGYPIASLTDETAYAIEAKRHHISTIEPHKAPQCAGTLSPALGPA
jgi:hypothetical protein